MASKKKSYPYVVVRTFSAGVHVGELVSRKGKEVVLVKARRLWRWQGANTLNEIANHGVGQGSQVSEVAQQIELTEAIEVITCTPKARENLETATWAA
jgi:hypothetical protein